MSSKGDWRKLDALIEKMERLAEPGTVHEAVEQLGEATLELIDRGFERSTSPDGERWERPAYRKGRPLVRTGRLRRSWVLRLRGNSFEVVSMVSYAYRLQAGIRSRRGLVARRMVPDMGEITRRWESAMRKQATAWMRETMGDAVR